MRYKVTLQDSALYRHSVVHVEANSANDAATLAVSILNKDGHRWTVNNVKSVKEVDESGRHIAD